MTTIHTRTLAPAPPPAYRVGAAYLPSPALAAAALHLAATHRLDLGETLHASPRVLTPFAPHHPTQESST